MRTVPFEIAVIPAPLPYVLNALLRTSTPPPVFSRFPGPVTGPLKISVDVRPAVALLYVAITASAARYTELRPSVLPNTDCGPLFVPPFWSVRANAPGVVLPAGPLPARDKTPPLT